MPKIIENYTMTSYLGEGEYGKVYRAFHIDTRIEVAIKMISLDKFDSISKLAELTKQQIDTLRALEHNLHVIKFVEMIKSSNYVYLVYEYCQGGTLEDLLRQKGPLPQKEALLLFRQLINAIRSLHEHHILHRDIKPNNIFFKAEHLKLADFGFCKKLRSSDDFTQTSLGSPLYMAPQILNGDVYGSKADMWSCGIVLYEMLFGYCPYSHCNIKEMLQIYNGDRGAVEIPAEKFTVGAVTEMMLRRMLEKDQFRRISWEDFLYEYQLTHLGTILKKEKDFQYDLMKLMKKNSSLSSSQKRISTAFKFDWTKITDRNSSVHSQELQPVGDRQEQGLEEMLQVKKKIKEIEGGHRKMVQIALVLGQLLDSQQECHYSPAIMYFLVHTLGVLVGRNLAKLEDYLEDKKQFLAVHEPQTTALHKLQVVFRNQSKTLMVKTNSIKVSLMQLPSLAREAFKFPQKTVMRKYLKDFIKNVEVESRGVSLLSGEGSRQETSLLLRVVWGVCQVDEHWEVDQGISVKSETTKFQLSVQLSKYLVLLGI